MTRADAEREVRNVLRTVLGYELPENSPVTRSGEAAWDSLRHIEILLAIEGACGIRFDESEMGALDSLDKLVASVESHRAA